MAVTVGGAGGAGLDLVRDARRVESPKTEKGRAACRPVRVPDYVWSSVCRSSQATVAARRYCLGGAAGAG